jgi:hypothetical protein
MSHNYPLEPGPAEQRASDFQTPATPKQKTTQHMEPVGQAAIWSPCYMCIDNDEMNNYPSLIIIQLLMHEIWVWENQMSDEDQTIAESEASVRSQNGPVEQVPEESELLPCHYFDFFYGSFNGGLVATLLGRLRLTVDDATSQFQSIVQQAMRSRRRELSIPQASHRNILEGWRSEIGHLVNAVHDAVTNHPVGRTEPNVIIDNNGTDRFFRDPASAVAKDSLTFEGPRRAQTCVVVTVYIGSDKFDLYDYRKFRQLPLRTFRSGHIYQADDLKTINIPFSDVLCLTVAQAVLAATAVNYDTYRYESYTTKSSKAQMTIGTKTVKLFRRSLRSPTETAFEDYQVLCPMSSGSPESPNSDSRPPIYIKKSISDSPAMFLSIGSDITSKSGVRVPVDPMATPDGYYIERDRHMYVRLRPKLRLDDCRGFKPSLGASVLRVVYDSMIKAVNNDEELKTDLRRAAKELVRRRRARQGMGGPRWEVFTSNMVETGDGDGEGRN